MSDKYVYTFEVLMGYNGIKGLTEKPFTTTRSVNAQTKYEAIVKLDEETDKLGFKVLTINSEKLETTNGYEKRMQMEFSKISK